MFISFLIKEKHNFKIECKSTTYIYGPETTDVTSGGDGKKGVRAVYMPNVRDWMKCNLVKIIFTWVLSYASSCSSAFCLS